MSDNDWRDRYGVPKFSKHPADASDYSKSIGMTRDEVNHPEYYKDDEVKGRKYDDGKPRWSLLTRSLAMPLLEVVMVLTDGAKKYNDENWKIVPDAGVRYEDAIDRHLNQWKRGETHDTESGYSHLAHVVCNVLFLMWFELNKKSS